LAGQARGRVLRSTKRLNQAPLREGPPYSIRRHARVGTSWATKASERGRNRPFVALSTPSTPPRVSRTSNA
jgi:hypothetical protein